MNLYQIRIAETTEFMNIYYTRTSEGFTSSEALDNALSKFINEHPRKRVSRELSYVTGELNKQCPGIIHYPNQKY